MYEKYCFNKRDQEAGKTIEIDVTSLCLLPRELNLNLCFIVSFVFLYVSIWHQLIKFLALCYVTRSFLHVYKFFRSFVPFKSI